MYNDGDPYILDLLQYMLVLDDEWKRRGKNRGVEFSIKIQQLTDYVYDNVDSFNTNPMPPFFVGFGIKTTGDKVYDLYKKLLQSKWEQDRIKRGGINMFGQHLNDMRTLMDLKRYQTRFRHKQRSVAEHSWFVCKVGYGLGYWENNKFDTYKIDMTKLMFMLMNHDIPEVYTGDVISSTKNMSAILKEEFNKVEETILVEKILPTMPKSWGKEYLDMYAELKEHTTPEAKLVKAADLIDRLFECKEEIDLMNMKPFEDILKSDLHTLMSFARKFQSVAYFLKYSILDIGISEYLSTDQKAELESMDFTQYF